jgi:uncharacterized protein YbaA (DUF1428 family)
MARYVDGFVLAVPRRNLDEYRKMARKAAKVWVEHGALEVRETVADDVKRGKVTSFPQSVKLGRGEVVVFSYIVYRSRAQRDRVNAKVMADPRVIEVMETQGNPFDASRMFWGGFETIVQVKA